MGGQPVEASTALLECLVSVSAVFPRRRTSCCLLLRAGEQGIGEPEARASLLKGACPLASRGRLE